jgi:WD40 repeat protein
MGTPGEIMPRMKVKILILASLCIPFVVLAQDATHTDAPVFPNADFLLHVEFKAQEPRVVLGPMKTDGQGKTTGSFAVYGGPSLVQVSSLSFSGDGKFLAVGSTPNIVDVWDVQNRVKIRSFTAGTTVALSPDGRILATDGKGIQTWDLSSGKLQKAIKWTGGTIRRMSFDSSGTRLLVTANGENDSVFDVITGKQIAALVNTQEAQFSRDGLLVVGGNAKHIIVWNTKDWSQVRDLPNGPDYVTRFAVRPEKDLVVVGGPKSARLVRLSSGEELATVGVGYTNFAAFDQSGSLIFTYPSSGFAVWDASGKQLCGTPHLGNGTVALSPNDRWLAAGDGQDVKVWKVENILTACRRR